MKQVSQSCVHVSRVIDGHSYRKVYEQLHILALERHVLLNIASIEFKVTSLKQILKVNEL